MPDFFPLDIAFDEAFFDRDKERLRLIQNIKSNTHTLITAPRRYGKTSLVLKVLSDAKGIVSSKMDMMVASNPLRMQNIILNGIGKASTEIAKGKNKIKEIINKIFQPFHMIETFELGKLSIRFRPLSAKSPHLNIIDALERLEVLAEETNKKVALFFDEYQHIFGIKDDVELEAGLRSFAQTAKHVVCLFSGSNRHLLQEVFNDSTRPFYNMCDHILLERISKKDYKLHLSQLSQQRWGNTLSDNNVDFILELTKRHSYFVNALCRQLWNLNNLPTLDKILETWRKLASEKRYEISNDFEKLTPIQRSILIELANEPFAQPTSTDVVKRLDASISGIANAMAGLLQRDHIYQEETGNYRVLNPLMEYVLRQEMN